jgi:hypothetical protein|tara:strand:+ start:362 stop:532 length:171 start_codon:yes stop_codon:yes gene_type:complete
MPNKSEQEYRRFNDVLRKLKDNGEISDAPPPTDREGRKEYITKLTKLFKKEVYGSD